jgi:subtilisin family serine protease
MKVRVAIIDSGVYPEHPHVGGVTGGIAIDDHGRLRADYLDRLGHGTAVAAAIKEKAPQADLYAVKVFDRVLSTSITALVAAIDWAAGEGMHLANLSLGTSQLEHQSVLSDAVARAGARGLTVVAARDDGGVQWLPGSLPGVVPVQLDWTCPRDAYRVAAIDGRPVFRASGFARPIDGVPPERNLNGISFAVANITGVIARRQHEMPDTALTAVIARLAADGISGA